MHIRTADIDDLSKIRILYKEVARHEGGIARLETEITDAYISKIITKSLATGLIIVAEDPDDPDRLIGEIHAYKGNVKVSAHVLSGLTMVVHPQFQGKKIGRTIFTIFLEEISHNRPDVGKVELVVREHNRKAIELYRSLGFKIEGRLEMKIKNLTGQYEAVIPMGWSNPNYEF